jgi:sugar phosphate isomerase/epimerase
LRVIDVCAPLAPRAWIAHLEGIGPDTPAADVGAWQGWCGETLAALRAAAPADTPIAVENLGYDWILHRDLAEDADCMLCCDIGHLWLYFPDTWEDQLSAMLPRTAVIHLHGVADCRDHVSLRKSADGLCRSVLNRLQRVEYGGVVTLEVFNETDFVESASYVRSVWETLYL